MTAKRSDAANTVAMLLPHHIEFFVFFFPYAGGKQSRRVRYEVIMGYIRPVARRVP